MKIDLIITLKTVLTLSAVAIQWMCHHLTSFVFSQLKVSKYSFIWSPLLSYSPSSSVLNSSIRYIKYSKCFIRPISFCVGVFSSIYLHLGTMQMRVQSQFFFLKKTSTTIFTVQLILDLLSLLQYRIRICNFVLFCFL